MDRQVVKNENFSVEYFVKNTTKRCEKEISVVVASYNPKWNKMQRTLDSIIGQQNVDMEIVITDDGSSNSMHNEVVDYLTEHGVENFVYISHESNKGTTINIHDGVSVAMGKYVKLISPGDILATELTLRKWCDHLLGSGRKWSVSDYKCFVSTNTGIKFEEHNAHPDMIDCYLNGNETECRRNYLIFEDLACGAATLIEREFAHVYLDKLVGIAKLAEDHMYRLMVLDGFIASFYPEICVLYEWGEGVSTQTDSPYTRQLMQDYNKVDELIYNLIRPEDKLYGQVRKAYQRKLKMPYKIWLFARFLNKGYLKYWIQLHREGRMTKQ